MNVEKNRVVITGVGPVTSVAVGREALWTALVEGRSNVQPRTVAVDLGRRIELPIASMPPGESVAGLDTHINFLANQELEGYRDLVYALLAIELAVTDAGLEYDRNDNRIGVIQAFEAPGVERTVSRMFGLFTAPPPMGGPPPLYDLLAPCFYNMQAFIYVHIVGKAFGFHGYSTSVHNACSSGAYAIEAAAERIRWGEADVMIVAGGEAFDTGVRLEWFRRSDLYAKEPLMRPFDADSSGFFVGEGAGAIVLESETHAERRGAGVYATYEGGAFAQQGWKQVIPDVRASRLKDVISAVLSKSNVSVAELDLIVPHGASTQLSDGYEAACLAGALTGQRDQAVVTAFKPYVGHMLAASGIVDSICMLLSIKHQAVPATLHTRPKQVQLPVPLATSYTERQIRTALKLFTGFTGHDAALIFRRA